MEFENKKYKGWVTVAPKGRKTPAYRLWYTEALTFELKDTFLMSFVRDIKDRLRKSKVSMSKNAPAIRIPISTIIKTNDAMRAQLKPVRCWVNV